MQNPIGCCTSGSPANSVTLNPSGTTIVRAASTGGSGASTTGSAAREPLDPQAARRTSSRIRLRRFVMACLNLWLVGKHQPSQPGVRFQKAELGDFRTVL